MSATRLVLSAAISSACIVLSVVFIATSVADIMKNNDAAK